jgi:hypothetical protein
MNPEVTMTGAAGIDTRFLAAASVVPRNVDREKPTPDFNAADLIEEPKIHAAETARRDSLEFLHKLVMG